MAFESLRNMRAIERRSQVSIGVHDEVSSCSRKAAVRAISGTVAQGVDPQRRLAQPAARWCARCRAAHAPWSGPVRDARHSGINRMIACCTVRVGTGLLLCVCEHPLPRGDSERGSNSSVRQGCGLSHDGRAVDGTGIRLAVQPRRDFDAVFGIDRTPGTRSRHSVRDDHPRHSRSQHGASGMSGLRVPSGRLALYIAMTPITVGAVISSQAPRGGLAVSYPRTTLSGRAFRVRLRDRYSRLLNGKRLARGFLAFRQREL